MSQLDLLLPLTLFALSMSITPGPNNILLTASGVNFGFRRTIPHILGVAFGFPVMVVAIGLGLGGVFEAYPQIHQVLKFVGIAYLLWLAWKIATSAAPETAARKPKPMNFLQAAAFQWVNPKAWITIAGAIATYTTLNGDVFQEILLITIVFACVTLPSISLWTAFGTAIGRLLRAPRARAVFNWSMAGLLVASLLPFAFG